MAPLPKPNPIDLGLLPKGMPIDHIRTSSEYCFLCDAQTQQHLFKLITAVHVGFGAPWFVRPFLNRSSTRGKTGQRQQYSVCTVCSMTWAADETTRQLVLDFELGDTAIDRALREMFSTLRCEGLPSNEPQLDAMLDRVNSEFERRHPERWAQLESEQNAETLDAAISVAKEKNIDIHLTPAGADLAREHKLEIGDIPQASMGPAGDGQAFDTPDTSAKHSPTAGPDTQGLSSEWMHQLKEIGRLRDDGLLTDDEFQAEKTRILRDKDQ